MGIIRWLRRIIILGLVVFAATVGAVVYSTMTMLRDHAATQEYPEKFDVILVVGSGIDPDLVLGYSSRRRVRTAAYLLERGDADRLIFSGGKLRDNRPVLGEKMKEFAVEIGVDPNLIDVEGNSRTTWENFRFSHDMIDASETRIGLVSDPTHLQRALALNDYLGGPEMIPIASFGQFETRKIDWAYEVSREALAWWYNLGKVLLWEGLGVAGVPEAERGKYVF